MNARPRASATPSARSSGGIGSMPGPMRQLAVVQFFTWFGLFCMWIYFAPGVAKGIFRGVPLGVANATVDRALDLPRTRRCWTRRRRWRGATRS